MDYFRNGFASSTILEREDLTFGVTSIISKSKLNHESPTVIGNHMMYNTSFNMIFGGEIAPRLVSNNNHRKVLLIGIGVPNEIRTQWNNLESPMHIAYVLDKPKVIMKIPALNEFVHIKPDANKRYRSTSIKNLILFVELYQKIYCLHVLSIQ